MKLTRREFWQWVVVASLAGQAGSAQAQSETGLVIDKTADSSKAIPIAISGFTGEAAAVLRFDLEVMGCKVVATDQATYLVSGKNEGNVQGFLHEARSKKQRLGKAYSGGTQRVQTHAFADDVILEITGVKGIAQTQVAFKVDRGTTSEIYLSDFDGHGPVQVTRDNSIVSAPSWVPGQQVIYYNSYKSGFPDIYRHELGGVRRVVAKFSGSNITPAASPDGRRVAMILSKGGNPNLYVANADGSGLVQLTRTKEGESSPCWSPDGRTICVVSRTSGRPALYLVPTSGGGTMKRLMTGVMNATEPDWSPDGKWLAFTSQMGSFQICVVSAEGGEAKTLVAGADPSWAPNSRTLAFVRASGRGMRGLSLLDVPTKQVKDCALVAGSNSQPSWAR
jgi:TolB protein